MRVKRPGLIVQAYLWCVFMSLAVYGADTPAPSVSAAAWNAPGTLAYHLSTNLVPRTNGIDGIYGATMELSNWRYAGYSGKDLAALTNAVWSARFWLKGVQGLGATCIGFSNGLGGQGLATMVSPRHYLCATHMHPEGYMAAFLDTNNVIHWRKTLQRVDLPPDGNAYDTSVGILDADLPPSVGYLPVIPADITNRLQTDAPITVQGLGMNQELRIFSQPMIFGSSGVIAWNSARTSPFGVSTDWNTALRGGDSSDPAMLLLGRQLVLVSHNYTPGGGPDYAFQIASINRAMHYLSTNNAIASDYQLTAISLTNWPAIR